MMRRALAWGLLCAFAALPLTAQESSWVRAGGYAVGAGLAGPAGGPVADVSFLVDGRTLLATTASGRAWVSRTGGDSWTLAESPAALGTILAPLEETAAQAPEPGAHVIRHPYRAATLFALGFDLWLSPDDGDTWIAVTGEEAPLIGSDQSAIAFDPFDADRIFVANAYGLWRSADGGLTWYGLNQTLPNFPTARFTPGAPGAAPLVSTERFGAAELAVGFGVWRMTDAAPADPSLAAPGLDGPVTALWRHPENPETLLAVQADAEGSRILRTVDGGALWDDLTANLPAGAITAVTASAETGAVYVAGEAGVFFTESDLDNPAPATAWTAVTGALPAAQIDDVYLEPASGRLYAAVSGYGVYRRRAPDVVGRLRALNAADLSSRPAAPGGLVTVQGATVDAASVAGVNAPILAATSTEAQIQIPFQTSGREIELLLSTAAGDEALALAFAQVSPAIFVDAGEPLVLRAATGRLLDLAHPARGGDRLLILATGLGQVSPAWPTGAPAPLDNPPATVEAVDATLNGVPLRVLSSTLAGGYIGAYWVEVELPVAVNAGAADLTLSAGGQESNSVRLFIAP